MAHFTLNGNWRLLRTAPDQFVDPHEIDWQEASDLKAPGVVASSVGALRALDTDATSDIDAFDWWYSTPFDIPPDGGQILWLEIQGLATIAEVWLNGQKILESDNMFRRYQIRCDEVAGNKNELAMVFRSISENLKAKRPRGRWKTQLVNNQQLRWIRTSLLGRIPGWTPPLPAIGPWRPIRAITDSTTTILQDNSWTSVSGGTAELHVDVTLSSNPSSQPKLLNVAVNNQDFELPIGWENGVGHVSSILAVDGMPLWSPHTEGTPERATLRFRVDGDADILTERKICFREIAADRSEGGFELSVNGMPVFCRGGCWSIGDINSFSANDKKLRETLAALAESGLNMIRVGGTMCYEADTFYELCDEFGILVWQDFMFASMDYPSDDEDFLDNVKHEVQEQATRLRRFGSVAVFCGSSETEQQAAMFGKDRETWEHPLFRENIPDWLDELDVRVPFVPSSPCDGPLPFHNAIGISHYFGVGAYLQGEHDLERSRVRFASECLAFSNIPCQQTLREHFGTDTPAVHTPAWKQGVPRDSGTGWDFEDVRDHYLQEIFEVNPSQLRYENNSRYLFLSSITSGEVMAKAYDHWRTDQRCAGALVWFLNDIQPGAGWGLIDSNMRAKPALNIVRESWQPIAISVRDRGMDGISVLLNNSRPEPFSGFLSVRLFADSRRLVSEAEQAISLAGGERFESSLDHILGTFSDHLHRYRFGPRRQDTISVRLHGHSGRIVLSRQLGLSATPLCASDCSISVTCDPNESAIEITADRALRRVRLSSPNVEFSENYFDLIPDESRIVTYRQLSGGAVRGTVCAANWLGESYFRF